MDICSRCKISCFSKVLNILKIRLFMLGFCTHALHCDPYKHSYFIEIKFKTMILVCLGWCHIMTQCKKNHHNGFQGAFFVVIF